MLVALALHWLLVPVARATQFPERLLQPALMILPIYLFTLVERGLATGGPPARAVRHYALALAAVAGVALAARIGAHTVGAAAYCRSVCRDLLPVGEIARQLRDAGFTGNGTVVVRDVHLGGNLRVQFPQARVMATGYPATTWPRLAGNGQCLAAWTDYGIPGERQRADVRAYLVGQLGLPADAKGREGEVTAQYPGMQRTFRLFYELYDAPQGACR
jgi:hypothetical protein